MMKSEKLPIYHYDSSSQFINDEIKKAFWENGFIIVRSLLESNEIEKLRESLESPNSSIMKHSYDQDDGDGRFTRMCLWNHPGNDLTGVISRSKKFVDTCESILDQEVYHYHTKLVMKEPHTGGAFQWHQDYGYWYLNGIFFPDMVSIQVGIDDMDTGNGCLQVLRGSHKMGRIEHGRVGEQAGADIERVKKAEEVFERVAVELKAGDGVVFHCNLLHRSDQNHSDRRRWSFISCYNAASNNPTKEHHHACYTPIVKVNNSEIIKCTNLNEISGKWFINPNTSHPDYLPSEEDGIGKLYGIEAEVS